MLAGHQPFSSGRVGRPLWQGSVADDEKQQWIKSFFHPTPSSASNTAGSSGVSSSSKGKGLQDAGFQRRKGSHQAR
ncbi:unnamed protein product [Calypogeia fissa]